MAAPRTDQTRERRQFRIALTRLFQVLIASGDLKPGAFRATDKVSAVVSGRSIVLVRDRDTVREVPDAEIET